MRRRCGRLRGGCSLRLLHGGLLAWALLWCGAAGVAAETTMVLQPISTLYIYQERDVFGEPLDRTRGMQELTLYAAGAQDWLPWELLLYTRMTGEFGRDHTNAGILADQRRVQLHLMLAQLRFPRVFNAIDLTLGRQILNDECGLNLVDGATLTVRRDWYFGLSLSLGAAVRNITYGDEDAYSFGIPNYNPFSTEAALSDDRPPAGLLIGMSAFLDNLPDTYLKLSWRRVYVGGDLEEDRLAVGARQDLFDRALSLDGQFEYNFHAMQVQRGGFGLDGRFLGVELGAAYQYVMPLFPGDSIFVVFPYVAYKELKSHLSITTHPEITLGVSYSRYFYDDSGFFPTAINPPGQYNDEVSADLTWRPTRWPLTLSGFAGWSKGYGGHWSTAGLRVKGTVVPDELELSGQGVMQYYDGLTWYDALSAHNVTGFGGGGLAALSWRFIDPAAADIEVSYTRNAIRSTDLRVVVQVRVEAIP